MPLITTIVAVFVLLAFAGYMEFRFWRSLGRLIRSWRHSS